MLVLALEKYQCIGVLLYTCYNTISQSVFERILEKISVRDNQLSAESLKYVMTAGKVISLAIFYLIWADGLALFQILDTINFLASTNIIHPTVHPWGRIVGSVLWDQNVINLYPGSAIHLPSLAAGDARNQYMSRHTLYSPTVKSLI